ncbi:hypothetical protein [Pseudodesulfovibrio sp.]|uniref:hypothetical protein n=1 Tax=unclassified Pseudodesulfovibrio TaxID=2661612 RepID=UPI003AFF67ED
MRNRSIFHGIVRGIPVGGGGTEHVEVEGNTLASALIGSAKGMDHSVHDYFLYQDMGYEKIVTPPFISPFTGEQVRLISCSIYNSEGLRYVVRVETACPDC